MFTHFFTLRKIVPIKRSVPIFLGNERIAVVFFVAPQVDGNSQQRRELPGCLLFFLGVLFNQINLEMPNSQSCFVAFKTMMMMMI